MILDKQNKTLSLVTVFYINLISELKFTGIINKMIPQAIKDTLKGN